MRKKSSSRNRKPRTIVKKWERTKRRLMSEGRLKRIDKLGSKGKRGHQL